MSDNTPTPDDTFASADATLPARAEPSRLELALTPQLYHRLQRLAASYGIDDVAAFIVGPIGETVD